MIFQNIYQKAVGKRIKASMKDLLDLTRGSFLNNTEFIAILKM